MSIDLDSRSNALVLSKPLYTHRYWGNIKNGVISLEELVHYKITLVRAIENSLLSSSSLFRKVLGCSESNFIVSPTEDLIATNFTLKPYNLYML